MRWPDLFLRVGVGALLLLLLVGPLSAWPVPTEAEKAYDADLSNLNSMLAFSSRINPTPLSAAREKKKFFTALRLGIRYEPQFAYESLTATATELVAALRKKVLPTGSAYSPFLRETTDQLLAKFAALQARGTDRFPALAAALYPLATPAEVTQAQAMLKRLQVVPPPKELTLSDKDMAGALRKGLKEHGLSRWKVTLSAKMSASASVLPSARKINLRKGARYGEEDIHRLTVHEIGVHAQRAENGHAMPLGIFRIGLQGYLETEEGMAAYNEDRHGIRDGLRLFALRVLAVDWATRLPFSQVFDHLRALGVAPERAWGLTQRVKRGLVDTGQPGCYPKDVSYFRGYLLVSRHMAGGGSWDELMAYGKIGLIHLPALRGLAVQK